MAKVETRQLPADGKFNTIEGVVRALRGAVADEMSAANLYSELREALRASGQMGTILDWLLRIQRDEETHAGALLKLIDTLDGEVSAAMGKGAEDGP